MTTHSLDISWIDALSDTLSHTRRQIADFVSTRSAGARPAGTLHGDIAALPDHLLRDIGVEPHQLALPASEFRTQVDASGFRQSAFTVDAHDMRDILAAQVRRAA